MQYGIEEVAWKAARELEARYGLADPRLGARLDGGYANDLFRVEAGGRAWVLRLEHPPVDKAGLRWEHDVVRRLSERMPQACAPVTGRGGTTWFPAGDRMAWLMPFVVGAPADAARRAHRDAAAVALGRLHAAGARMDLAQRPRRAALPEMAWPPLVVPEPLADLAGELAEDRKWAIELVRRLAVERQPRSGLVHGDYFPGNVMIHEDELAGVLDWEETGLDWVSWDLASALGTFCFAGDTLDHRAAREFLAAYRDAGGTAPPQERDVLVGLMRVKRTLEVLRAPTDREPRWEHQRHNLRAIRALRHELDAVRANSGRSQRVGDA